ncbi:hypothetical protein HGRIS_009312 [Hohenbuehelia grisea]|uniref:Hydrophobin n=1 Tax=Hohenbuehelia grisea TaxID=104357 RepID=A0ABR3J0T1_9AGAR
MFANTAALFALAAATFASFTAALPQTLSARAQGSCGNTGALHCCNNIQESDSDSTTQAFNLLGLGDLLGSQGQVGFACSPIVSDTGLAGSTSWWDSILFFNYYGAGANLVFLFGISSQQTACCEGTQFNGLIAMGCSSMNLLAAA